MATEIDVINTALSSLGEGPISTLSDGVPAARLANRTYADYRDDLLRDYAWNFATLRFSLSASATAPLFEFDNAYLLPSDYLRLISGGINNPNNKDYRVEYTSAGPQVVTNIAAPLQGKYVAQITTMGLWDPKARDLLSAKLALEWAEAVTGSDSKAQLLAQTFREKQVIARVIDAQEDFIREGSPNGWIDARN